MESGTKSLAEPNVACLVSSCRCELRSSGTRLPGAASSVCMAEAKSRLRPLRVLFPVPDCPSQLGHLSVFMLWVWLSVRLSLSRVDVFMSCT